MSSVYVETEQTSRVSALAGDLPERFSLFIHHVLSWNDFSVVLFLFIVYWVGRLKLKTKSEAPMQNFWSLFDIMLSKVHVNSNYVGCPLKTNWIKCQRWKIVQ